MAAGLILPGVAGNFVSAPDTAGLSITSDIDLRAKVALTDWTPAADNALVGKWDAALAAGYLLNLLGGADAGKLQLILQTVGDFPFIISNAPLGITDGATKWVRGTWVQSTGVMSLFVSDDGSTWTPVVGTTTNANTTTIIDGTQIETIGSQSDGTAGIMTGTMHRAMIISGVGGTTRGDFNTALVTKLGTRNPTSYTDPQGNLWTVNGSAWDWG